LNWFCPRPKLLNNICHHYQRNHNQNEAHWAVIHDAPQSGPSTFNDFGSTYPVGRLGNERISNNRDRSDEKKCGGKDFH
jgi:hypothetical protein